MIENLEDLKIAVIGGGSRCKLLLQAIFSEAAAEKRPKILGVADKNLRAGGLQYAQEKGIFTTSDYRELFSIPELDLILELTPDDSLKEIIKEAKPPGVLVVDHYEARAILDVLQIRAKKNEVLHKLRASQGDGPRIEALFEEFYSFVAEINRAANTFARETRESLVASESVMSQIINGSTIPTFVIDKEHILTHWNKALEHLTGYPAGEMIGTRNQWAPFYENERPSMADVILDQTDESQIRKLYGSKWRRSPFIDGAYESEGFFARLGKSGKWCWFTAAPIQTPEGETVGAIETIWDKTEERNAEKERERHTKELATFCSIYATLSGALTLEGRIKAAIEEVASIFLLDGICIFIVQPDGSYQLRYSCGHTENLCFRNRKADAQSMVVQVARSGKVAVFDELPATDGMEIELLQLEGLQSLLYIPIQGKDKRGVGVVRAASRRMKHFGPNEVRAMELIANRIGVPLKITCLRKTCAESPVFRPN